MPSNRTVTYVDIDLNSVGAYWETTVVPNVRDFLAKADPRTAINAAISIWHFHEWVWHDQNPGQDSAGEAFRAFQNGLTAECPELGWIRDVTDAGKHRGLGRKPEVLEAKPRLVRTASLPLLLNTQETLIYTLVLSDGSHINYADALKNAAEYWAKKIPTEQLSSPYE